jgi:hypothetical protein
MVVPPLPYARPSSGGCVIVPSNDLIGFVLTSDCQIALVRSGVVSQPPAPRLLRGSMTVKLLQPAEGKFDSAIIGVNGKLRMLDQPRRCGGYANACCCPSCLKREAQRLIRPKPTTCECERSVHIEGSCLTCGKAIARRAA